MIALRLVSHRPERRDWLEAMLNADTELKVVCSVADVDDIIGSSALHADVIVVDLAHPRAVESRFWSALHVYFPGARLMALVDAPIVLATLEAALHAGPE